MILIDFSPLIISNFMGVVRNSNDDFHMEHEDLIRHITLSNIRQINSRFKKQYGEIILAIDSKRSWRKEIFPYYKENRKEMRNKDLIDLGIDWKDIGRMINKVKEELIEYSPYKVIEVEFAEADDIIGILTVDCIERNEEVLIISRDKDFQQLNIGNHGLVSQWNKKDDIFIEVEDPSRFIFEHVLKGDSSDGIPNILSPIDSFITKTRQKPMTSKKIEYYWENRNELEGNERFELNKKLIVLKYIPDDIKNDIREKYEIYQVNDKSKLAEYFLKFRLKKMYENINDF